jgi:hypothetical protein
MNHRILNRPTTAIVMALGLLLSAVPARGAAMFDGSVSATLTITGITHAGGGVGVALAGVADPPLLFDSMVGAATASATGSSSVLSATPSDMGVGDGLTATVMGTGSASLPVGSIGEVLFALSDAYIDIGNDSSVPVTVDFEVAYSLSVDSSISQPLGAADVMAGLAVFSVGVAGIVDFVSVGAASDSDAGSSDGLITMAATTPTLSVTVPPMDFMELDLSLDTSGTARSPEPSTAIMLLCLGSMGVLRRRGL